MTKTKAAAIIHPLNHQVHHQGTCALIMYLLGERSSPLHCGQNPLL
ncbi:hypothetical protein IQ224_00420 [Microcystis sp. LEGE 00066]|nr:hypothetical protein [Microcystis sp. LEGE 00066]NCS26655.1 hypothetical protein [Microcystis aeruginosa BS13-02]TRU04066.1 MAG: hypothetical protein EWV61_07420 [Microcystis aeruginosa Ma_AC_P_19900807_S300]